MFSKVKLSDIENSSLNLAEIKFYEVGLGPPCLLWILQTLNIARNISQPSADRVMPRAEVRKCYSYEQSDTIHRRQTLQASPDIFRDLQSYLCLPGFCLFKLPVQPVHHNLYKTHQCTTKKYSFKIVNWTSLKCSNLLQRSVFLVVLYPGLQISQYFLQFIS